MREALPSLFAGLRRLNWDVLGAGRARPALPRVMVGRRRGGAAIGVGFGLWLECGTRLLQSAHMYSAHNRRSRHTTCDGPIEKPVLPAAVPVALLEVTGVLVPSSNHNECESSDDEEPAGTHGRGSKTPAEVARNK